VDLYIESAKGDDDLATPDKLGARKLQKLTSRSQKAAHIFAKGATT
jgi:hypothetical protein